MSVVIQRNIMEMSKYNFVEQFHKLMEELFIFKDFFM